MKNLTDTLEVELRISEGNAEVVLNKTREKLEDFARRTEKVEPSIKFSIPNQSFMDLDKLERRAFDIRKQFEQITTNRLDAGKFGDLTKDIVRASERSRQLASDITALRKELSNPNRKSSIAFLTEELKAAEREAAVLEKRIVSLSARGAGGDTFTNQFGSSNRLSSFQKQNLAYQINDVATMAAMGANPMQILASQGGQIAQIFQPAQIAAFTAAYGGLVSILGAGTIAIAATYKITGDLRREAERRLKVEEGITGAINRQILSQKEALKNQAELSRQAQSDFEFQQRLAKNKKDDLVRERDLLKRLNEGLSAFSFNGKGEKVENENFARNRARIQELENQIRANSLSDTQKADAAFTERWESWKKSQESAIEAEERLAEANKKRLEDIDEAKEKVKQLEQQYISTFDALYLRANSDNPFVAVFSEGDRALKDLRENLKGLPPEVQAVAEAMQQKINLRALLGANLSNKLSVFDLRQDAANFRNPFDDDRQKKDQDEFISRFLRNNPNYLFLQNKRALDDDERATILRRFAPSALTETAADRFNKSLDEKFSLIYKPRQTAEELAAADKQFISLTQGTNPLDLNRNLREQAALAREREAIRQERYFQDALALDRQKLAVQQQIAQNTRHQNRLAEQGGTKAIDVRVFNESGNEVSAEPRPTANDTANYYDPNLSFGTTGGLTNR